MSHIGYTDLRIAEMKNDLDKLFARGRYASPSNLVAHDGYFAQSLVTKYGMSTAEMERTIEKHKLLTKSGAALKVEVDPNPGSQISVLKVYDISLDLIDRYIVKVNGNTVMVFKTADRVTHADTKGDMLAFVERLEKALSCEASHRSITMRTVPQLIDEDGNVMIDVD